MSILCFYKKQFRKDFYHQESFKAPPTLLVDSKYQGLIKSVLHADPVKGKKSGLLLIKHLIKYLENIFHSVSHIYAFK